MTINFEEFRRRVSSMVKDLAPDANVPFQFELQTFTWRRGAVSLTLGENAGQAFVSYVAPATDLFGHRSMALPFPISVDGAEQAARYIVDRLGDPYMFQ